ncbi:MAG: hypothetical protein HYW48_07310 [Deltaproteobacteria bacterium]|nr:hypothetical protein [Deltaproteobacteria bacterium]
MRRSLAVLFFLCGCVHQGKKEAKTMEAPKSSEVIADLKKGMVDAPTTLAGITTFRGFLKPSKKKLGFEKMILSYGIDAIVDPIARVMKTFLDDETVFSCAKDRTDSDTLSCSLTQANQHLFDMRLFAGSNVYWAHVCRSGRALDKISKDDGDFWGYVKTLAGGTSKEELLSQGPVSLNGVLIKFEKGRKWEVASFKASLGPVEDGSDEYHEFIAPNCRDYHLPHSEAEL